MKKLRLDLEELAVESFDTAPSDVAASRGTVEGYATELTCEGPTCPATCFFTCDNTCICPDPTGGFGCEPTEQVTCEQFPTCDSACQ